MVKVDREEKNGMSVNTLCQADSGRIRMRCNDCGLEWESSQDEVTCPLRELEATFLSEDWFVVSSEETY